LAAPLSNQPLAAVMVVFAVAFHRMLSPQTEADR
jgi:hypothetical protein